MEMEKAVSISLHHHHHQPKQQNLSPQQKAIGIVFIVLSCMLSPLSSMIVKGLMDYHPFTLGVWRYQGILWPSLISLIWHLKVDGARAGLLGGSVVPPHKRPKTIFMLLMRCFLGSTSLLFHYNAVRFISVPDATVITYTSTIFVPLFASIFLGERCGMVPVLAGAIAIFGVVIIAKPPLLTGGASYETDTLLGTSLALGSMICIISTPILLRYLRGQGLHHAFITTTYGFVGTLYSLFLSYLFGHPFQFPGQDVWTFAFGLAIFSYLAQYLITVAFTYGSASFLGLLRTVDVVFAFMWNLLLLGTVPEANSVIGGIIVVSGIILMGMRNVIDDLDLNHPYREKFHWLLK